MVGVISLSSASSLPCPSLVLSGLDTSYSSFFTLVIVPTDPYLIGLAKEWELGLFAYTNPNRLLMSEVSAVFIKTASGFREPKRMRSACRVCGWAWVVLHLKRLLSLERTLPSFPWADFWAANPSQDLCIHWLQALIFQWRNSISSVLAFSIHACYENSKTEIAGTRSLLQRECALPVPLLESILWF